MIFHVTSKFASPDAATQRRQALAQLTWAKQPWTEVPVTDDLLPRLYPCSGQRLPHIRDLFDHARRGMAATDIAVFTNADICVRSDCAARIAAGMQETDAAFCHRRDFTHDFDKPIPDGDIPKGLLYAGMDLFCWRGGWWDEQRNEFPDMLLGREAWDCILHLLIQETNAVGQSEMHDLMYHQRHYSKWEDGTHRYKLASQKHNIRLALAWLTERGIDPRPFGLRAI